MTVAHRAGVPFALLRRDLQASGSLVVLRDIHGVGGGVLIQGSAEAWSRLAVIRITAKPAVSTAGTRSRRMTVQPGWARPDSVRHYTGDAHRVIGVVCNYITDGGYPDVRRRGHRSR